MKFQRVDKRPKNLSSWEKYKPATVTQRENVVEKCGQACFLFPGGTGARPGVPAYPICATVEKTGGQCVLSCPGLEAAYKRLRMGIEHYTYPEAYKDRMRAAADRAIKLALPHADAADPTNTCNWALTAWRRTLGALEGVEGRFEDMAKMRMGECRVTRRGVKYCRTPRGVRFVGGTRRGHYDTYDRMFTGDGYGDGYYDGYGDYGGGGYGAARRGRGVPMRAGECRRTRRGVRYCRTPAGVRFMRG